MQPWLERALRGGTGAAPARAPLPVGLGHLQADLAYGDDPAQRLDVYLPAAASSGALLVVVHGGAWAMGDKANPRVIRHKVAHWLPRGHVVVSVNYRLLPRARPLAQAQDLAQALAFVQRHAASWQAPADRLVVIGHSTGAHLAALLAAAPGPPGAPDWLGAVLLDSTALDVAQVMAAPHLPLYDRAFGNDPAAWRAASPLHQLHRCIAPTLLVHSAMRDDSAAQARRFADAAGALGARVQVVSVDFSHAEINEQLGLDPVYTRVVDDFLGSLGPS